MPPTSWPSLRATAPDAADRSTVPHPGFRLEGGGPRWQEASPSRAAPTLLSLVVPGTGQLFMRQRRGWAYLALEALGWVAYADRRAEGDRFRTRYRDLAWTTARLASESRVDGDFPYYERLSLWSRSGRFDTETGTPGVQPETDPSTFNGTVWTRARGIFSVGEQEGPGSPGFDAAVAYYEKHAYGEAFLWDWTGAPEARDRYAEWIRESDERFREATWALGLLFANHLISAVDAWASSPASVTLAPASGGADGPAVQILLRWELHR